MNLIVRKLKNTCIVSCQALEDEPLYGSHIMASMAVAAKAGGASAIRANSPEDIIAIKKAVDLPIIGLYKVDYSNSAVYITPTMKEFAMIVEAGAEMVAIDATAQPRPDGRSLAEYIEDIRINFPDVLIVADVSTYEEGVTAIELDADVISTTMSGYTSYSPRLSTPDFQLISRLSKLNRKPILAEGRIWTTEDCVKCFQAGAYATVIGTAITRPQEITKRFVTAIQSEVTKSDEKGEEDE